MRTPPAANGRRSKRGQPADPAGTTDSLDLAELLTVLTAVRKGDFSVRMRVTRTGLAGKVADTLNEIVELNQEMAHELDRVAIAVGKEGRITQRAQLTGAGGSWAASINSVNGLIGDLVQPTSEVSRVIGAVAKGDLSQTMALDIEGRPADGRVPPHRPHGELDGGPAQLLRLGGDPRRPRGRYRGQAGRPGQGEGRGRHLEGPDGQRELDGGQPHGAGPQHRRGDDGGGATATCPRRSRWT